MHGPVIARGQVNGQPVAYTTQRSTFFGELDSAPAFALLNSDRVTDAQSFIQAMDYETGSFNWLYTDRPTSRTSTRGCIRSERRASTRTSRHGGRDSGSGTASCPSQHPQAINPSKGWMDSWNNKPAPGWSASDAQWGWGPVHRVKMLATRLAAKVPQGNVHPSDVVNMMADAATVDLPGQEVLLPFDDTNRRAHDGSSFQKGYYGYVQKSVQMALGQTVLQPYNVLRCADGTLAGCRAALAQSLQDTVNELGPDPSTWDACESCETIHFTAVGLVNVPDIPWQNRPTFQQVVEVVSHG